MKATGSGRVGRRGSTWGRRCDPNESVDNTANVVVEGENECMEERATDKV